MIYLCLDYGQKRTGVAVGNAEETLAFPRTTIPMTTRDAFFSRLFELVQETGAEGFVIGMPLHVDGAECLATTQVRNMVARLKRRTALPIWLMPEVLSSYEAEEDLRSVGRLRRDTKALIDQQAAVRILQTFFDQPVSARKPA